MLRYIYDTFIGLLILIVAFNYSIYFTIQAGFHIPVTTAGFQLYSAALTLITVFLYAYNFSKIPPKVNGLLIIAIVTVTILFFSTRIFYPSENANYNSYFLSMGVNFVPGILMAGVMLTFKDTLGKIEKGLIPFIVAYTFILAKLVSSVTVQANMQMTFQFGALTYQSISYYAIFTLGLTLYLATSPKTSIYLKWILICMAVLQFIMAIMAGGRGAMVLGVVFLIYFGVKKISLWKILFVAIMFWGLLTIVIPYVAQNDVFQLGFNRIFNFFSSEKAIEHDLRWVRWHQALDAFYDRPILGNGLGGVFYVVGFYSHNIFTDILCEGGIVLMTLFIYLLTRFIFDAKQLIAHNHQYEIIVVIFLCSFVMDWFSGYYLASSGIWLSLAYILGSHYTIYSYMPHALQKS